MSRLGKKPVPVPANVSVAISGRKVAISSGSKKLEYEHRPEVAVRWNQDEKNVSISIDEKDLADKSARAFWGLTRATIQNMVNGVTKGYEKTLEIVGVGYTAEVMGNKIKLKLGYANPIMLPIPAGLDVVVDKSFVRIKGADKQLVGQFAADIRSKRKPEPYNGKGVMYQGEKIRRKQGKAFGA